MDQRRKEEVISPVLRYKMPLYSPEDETSENINNPNIWFTKMFPESVKYFGPGFLQATYTDSNSLTRFVPVDLNEDAWAHALGGDKRLGHQVVYYLPEESWWFFDPTIGAFRATTEEKLKALLSNFLIRCSQDLGSLADIRPLVLEFRRTGKLEKVIQRAKALHSADAGFFSGDQGHKRMIDGKIVESAAKPSYALFVEKVLVKKPQHAITVTEAFSDYYRYCQMTGQPILTRAEFKHLVAEVIREEFQIGLRNDVPSPNGKQTAGWIGIGTRPLEEMLPALN